MAYNRGARLREAGGEVAELSAILPQVRPLTLTADELHALARLGEDAFRHWALRGWWEGE